VAGALSNFPTQIKPMLQANYLQTALQEYLIPNIKYWGIADHLAIPTNVGDTLTKTRPGLLAAQPDPVDPSAAIGLDNNMTPQQWAVEQYTLTLQMLNGTQDIDLLTKDQSIVDRFHHSMKTNLIQAAQSVDIYLRNCLFGGLVPSGLNPYGVKEGYLAGNTFVTGGFGAAAGTGPFTQTINVDDITGFASLYVNGVLTNVSPSNPIAIYQNGVNLVANNITVVGFTQDATVGTSKRIFNGPGNGGRGVSGTLSLSGPVTFTTALNDVITAVDAATILRPNGKTSYKNLTASDTFGQAQLLDAVALLRNRQVPPMADGRYVLIGDFVTMRQIFGDQDYKIATQGRFDSPFFKGAFVDEYLDMHIIQSSNAPVQLAATGGSSVTVRRPIICGKDVLVDGYYSGVSDFAETGTDGDGFADGIMMSHIRQEQSGTVAVVRPPLDRLSKTLSMSWMSIRDAIAPTDSTATPNIVLTGDNARRKRAVVVEHAG